jgi:RNA polymerase sigma factor (TIGR02999 family)
VSALTKVSDHSQIIFPEIKHPSITPPEAVTTQTIKQRDVRLKEFPGITALVTKIRDGYSPKPDSPDHQLLERVYQEIRSIANQAWLREKSGGMQVSDLVNESWLRIIKRKRDRKPWQSRTHFFNTVAKTMQQAIIDELRRRLADKREGQRKRIQMDLDRISQDSRSEDILAISETLSLLEHHDPDAATVVRMKFFLGLKMSEIASIRKCSVQDANKLWIYGRTWIKTSMKSHSVS